MPVFGHAFIGLGAAHCTKPRARDSIGAAIWVSIVLFISYVPDIICQISLFFGLRNVETIAHSLSAAVVLSLITSAGLIVLARLSFLRSFFLSLCFILVHDLLDLMHFPVRYFLWPFSSWRPNAEYCLPLLSIKEEIIIFGSLYLASRLLYWFWFEKRDSRTQHLKTTQQHYLEKLSRITVIIIFLCAGTTQYLRNNRIELFSQARTIILTSNNNYTRALELLAGADRWPYGAEQVRVEYYKARAYWGLGDIKQAEQHYLASLAEDPRSFNSIGDLALLYASGTEDAAQRRSRAEPYVKQLLAYHATHQDIKAYLKKIDAALGVPAGAGYAAGIPAAIKKAP